MKRALQALIRNTGKAVRDHLAGKGYSVYYPVSERGFIFDCSGKWSV